MLKRTRVIMLPTNRKSKVFMHNETKVLFARNIDEYNYKSYFQNQHIYIVSDDEITMNDWHINVIQFNDALIDEMPWKPEDEIHLKNLKKYSNYFKKVIASTDTSLGLPSPSNAFIQKYCELNGKIDDINVEYILQHDLRTDNKDQEFKYIPKVSSNNTITIKAIKDSFTRVEVIKILEELYYISQHPYFEGVSEWFNKNY